MEEVDAVAGDSTGGDCLQQSANAIRRDFKLDEDLTEPVERYVEFLDRVKALCYEERFANQVADGNFDTKKDTYSTDDSKARKKTHKKS